MPLVYECTPFSQCSAAVWEIEEPPEYFEEKLIFNYWEKDYLRNIRHPVRRRSWLASRYLIKILLKTDAFVELLFDINGKPFLGNKKQLVTISHTQQFAAAMIAYEYDIGIDVEALQRSVEHVSHKFLSATEKRTLPDAVSNDTLLLYWGAKEVMYKIHGRKRLDFRDHMLVHPFEKAAIGDMSGMITKDGVASPCVMSYIQTPSFSLVMGMRQPTEVLPL